MVIGGKFSQRELLRCLNSSPFKGGNVFCDCIRDRTPPRQTCLPGALLILLSPKEIAKKFTIRFSCSRIRLVIVKIISILLYSYRLNRTFYKHESGCLAGKGKGEQRRIKELTGRDVYVREFEDIKNPTE